METEARQTAGTDTPKILERRPQDLGYFKVSQASGVRVFLTHDEVQALVQLAYDQHGIMATPSYSREAALRVAGEGRGLCGCGMAGCSDAPVQS